MSSGAVWNAHLATSSLTAAALEFDVSAFASDWQLHCSGSPLRACPSRRCTCRNKLV